MTHREKLQCWWISILFVWTLGGMIALIYFRDRWIAVVVSVGQVLLGAGAGWHIRHKGGTT